MSSMFASISSLANQTASIPVASTEGLATEETAVGVAPADVTNASAVACTIKFCIAA